MRAYCAFHRRAPLDSGVATVVARQTRRQIASVATSATMPSVIHAVADEAPAIVSDAQIAPATAMPIPTPAKTAAPSKLRRSGSGTSWKLSRHHAEVNTSAHALATPASA